MALSASPLESWRILFRYALRLIRHIEAHGTPSPFWTFGGGTVLMLRHRHRRSKDIDIFVPDPQYLGYVTPRLSEVAEDIAETYVEGPGYVRLIRAEGEIDFVAATNLTRHAFDVWDLEDEQVRVETAVEIVSKKMWHRGDSATARDLFDLSLVIEREGEELASAAPFLLRHRDRFLQQIETRSDVLRTQFDALDTIDYRPTFEDAVERVRRFLTALPPP